MNAQAEDPALWDDPDEAQSLMRERTRLEQSINGFIALQSELDDNLELIALGEAEEDAEVVAEAEQALRALQAVAAAREVETLLSGEVDPNSAYLEVHAGAGGTESQDWANMLLRMYLRWADQHGYRTEIVELSEGEEAGIKSATVHVKGENAYGWMKTESGVHRLVRREHDPSVGDGDGGDEEFVRRAEDGLSVALRQSLGLGVQLERLRDVAVALAGVEHAHLVKSPRREDDAAVGQRGAAAESLQAVRRLGVTLERHHLPRERARLRRGGWCFHSVGAW